MDRSPQVAINYCKCNLQAQWLEQFLSFNVYSFSFRLNADCSGIYLFLPHGRQAGRGPRGHGRDVHLSGHLAHAVGCHIGSHGDAVEVHTIAVVHVVVVILLGELWRCLLL